MVLWVYTGNCWLAMGFSNHQSIRHCLTVFLNSFLINRNRGSLYQTLTDIVPNITKYINLTVLDYLLLKSFFFDRTILHCTGNMK